MVCWTSVASVFADCPVALWALAIASVLDCSQSSVSWARTFVLFFLRGVKGIVPYKLPCFKMLTVVLFSQKQIKFVKLPCQGSPALAILQSPSCRILLCICSFPHPFQNYIKILFVSPKALFFLQRNISGIDRGRINELRFTMWTTSNWDMLKNM